MNIMVSIIIPTHNYGFCILNTIESVLNQSYTNYELIVVDDGSEDNTREIIGATLGPKVRYIHQENRGANVARNRGFNESSGDYVIFLDSDDILAVNHLEEYLNEAAVNRDANIYGPSRKGYFIDGEFIETLEMRRCPSSDLLESWIKHEWWAFTSSVFWKRENFLKAGGWDETLHANQDGDIAMRALIEGARFIYAENAPPVLITSHKNIKASISDTKSKKTLDSRFAVFIKLEKILNQKNMLNAKYRNALGAGYYALARSSIADFPDYAEHCYRQYRRLCGLRKPNGSYMNWIGLTFLGIKNKTRLSQYLSKIFT
ncbi:glycosyltransferase family 2 protein [Desulfonatronum parangueonense]